jgi:hypothetical protein
MSKAPPASRLSNASAPGGDHLGIRLTGLPGTSRLISVVVLATLIMLGTAVGASGAIGPTLNVAPYSAEVAVGTFQYYGYGWADCGPVRLTLNTGALIAVDTPDRAGEIHGSFAAPSALGTYTLVATPNSISPGCSPQEGTFAVRPPSPTLVVDPPNNLAPGQEGNVEGSDWESCGGIRIALGATTLATYPPRHRLSPWRVHRPIHPETLRGDSHRCFNYLAGLL